MHEHLPRLRPEFYRGFAMVHWTMTTQNRATGWLDDRFHLQWREMLLHTATRYRMLCPTYCLMPDHAHILWAGIAETADQRAAMRFFRTHTGSVLSTHTWQKQSFDHVLREHEQANDAVATACRYIVENPVRKGLARESADWRFSGAMIPGYPFLDPKNDGFWHLFWRIYNELRATADVA